MKYVLYLKAYGETFISDDHFLALVGSIGTGFISVGRISWGFIVDRLPLRVSLFSSAFHKKIFQ